MVDSLDDVGGALPTLAGRRDATATIGVANKCVRGTPTQERGRRTRSYDVITTFDVIHDAVDSAGILRAIRAALRPAGRYVCVDINCLEQPIDNTGQTHRDSSTGSASATADGVPRRGRHRSWNLRPRRARPARDATDAAFRSVRHVPIDDPFNTIYELAC
jgi:hypothetical protein